MSTPEFENPILVIQDENQPARHWTLNTDNVVMGRGDECDITLNDRQVSRQHIRIYRQDSQYHIEDLIEFAKYQTSFRGLLPWKGQYPQPAKEEDRRFEQFLSDRKGDHDVRHR